MFDAGAEKIFIVDETGRILNREQSLALIVYLLGRSDNFKTIAIPVNESNIVEEIAKKNNISVIRTKTNLRSMMETATERSVNFFGEGQGGFIFPEFQPAFDAMCSTAKLLELLSDVGVPVSDIVDSFPKKCMIIEKIPCPHMLKGIVIRSIISLEKNVKMELIDGVKLYFGNDWTLITGHPDIQELNIYCESENALRADQLCQKYKSIIKEIIAKQLGKNQL